MNQTKEQILDLGLDYIIESDSVAFSHLLEDYPLYRKELESLRFTHQIMERIEDYSPAGASTKKILAFSSRFLREQNPSFLNSFFQFFRLQWNWAPALVLLFFAVSTLSLSLGKYFPWAGEEIVFSSESQSSQTLPSWPDHTLERASELPVQKVSVEDIARLENPFELKENTPSEVVTLSDIERTHHERQKLLLERDADQLLMQGRRYKSAGRIDLALRDFETIYRFYPNYTYMEDVLMYRAQCYAFQGKVDEAISSLELLIEKNPSKESLILPMIRQIEGSR